MIGLMVILGLLAVQEVTPTPTPIPPAPAIELRVEPMTPYRLKGPVVVRPTWKVRPTGEDFSRHYPERAATIGLGGQATLECLVHVSGAVRQCAVLSQTPDGWGFGVAALRMSRRFQMTPLIDDGVPVSGGVVRIPLRFLPPDGDAPPQTYAGAAHCLMVHRLRLKLFPGDPLSTANLGPTVRLFDSRARAERIAPEQKAEDQRVALAADEETWSRLERIDEYAQPCLIPL